MSIYDGFLSGGGFGLERETLRVDGSGRIAVTAHPFDDDKFERDFCESQLEIITGVCSSPGAALKELGELSEKAKQILKDKGEYIWLYSNPPHFDSEDDIIPAAYTGEKARKSEYRLKLMRRYGKRLMTYSGIHFNMSLGDDYISFLTGGDTSQEAKNRLYMKLVKYMSSYSWLPLLLTAASPVFDSSLTRDSEKRAEFDGYSSRRSSEHGYWNEFIPQLDHSSVGAYADSVRSYINKGALFAAGELYLPIRIKPRGDNSLESLEQSGADHIELRMFDVDPLAPYGVFEQDLEFAHMLLVYFAAQEDFDFTYELQERAIENHKAAAGFDLDRIKISSRPAREVAGEVLDRLSRFYDSERASEVIEYQRNKLSSKRYCDIIFERYRDDYTDKMLEEIKKR